MLRIIKKLIPKPLLSIYHFALALCAVLWYRFPSKRIIVIGITGTKGKSSTAELVNAVLEEAGETTALLSTIRFKIADENTENRFKMTLPGRFFVQHFLRRAVDAGCTYAIVELTSEGVLQHRHRFIDLDALIFTNLTPEHIEAHGSYENYVAAKLKLRDALEHSSKDPRWMVANTDSKHGEDFLQVSQARAVPYHAAHAEPYHVRDNGIDLTFDGTYMHSPLIGKGHLYNIIAAATLGTALGIEKTMVKRAVENLKEIPGRGQKVDVGQSFDVIVDYAHTPESLEQLYQSFPKRKKVCVLGSTGGGRDQWKRPKMGALAERYCDQIILTNEDPYDEDPQKIAEDIAAGCKKKQPEVIMNRRAAIAKALSTAPNRSVVLISGKGTDPFIMGPRGTKQQWSDKAVAKEELAELLKKEAQT